MLSDAHLLCVFAVLQYGNQIGTPVTCGMYVTQSLNIHARFLNIQFYNSVIIN